MEDFLRESGQTAFPILVTGFLLVRMEKKMEELTAAIVSLKESIIKSVSYE